MHKNPGGPRPLPPCPSLLTPMFIASLLDVQHKKGLAWRRPASSLVGSLGKALNGIASTFEWLDW